MAAASGSALLSALQEAVDLAETLHINMDYLGTGSDSKAAKDEAEQDRKTIERLKEVIAHGETQTMKQPRETQQQDAQTEAAEAGSVQRVVVLHEPKVSIRHAEAGAMEVMIDDWVYVRINYDYRYTDNASRMWLAKEVQKLLQHNDGDEPLPAANQKP